MSNTALILVNDHLAYDPSRPYISGDISYTTMTPAPKPPLSLGGGSSGGWGYMSSGAASSVRTAKRHKGTPAFAKAMAKQLLSGAAADIEKVSPHTIPKEESELAAKREIIRTLRERITKLEARIRELKGIHSAEILEILKKLQGEVEASAELKKAVEDLETTVERFQIAARVKSKLMGLADKYVDLEDSEAPPSSKLILAAAGYAAAEFLVPDSLGVVRDVAKLAAIVYGLGALYDLLSGR